MLDEMSWSSFCKMIWLEMNCVCIESKACCIGWSLTRYAVLVAACGRSVFSHASEHFALSVRFTMILLNFFSMLI
jgi:hypothetical protein